jgi:hypothetical protein
MEPTSIDVPERRYRAQMVWRTIVGGLVACVLFAMAVRTADLASRSGRSETAWFYYGLLVPVVSFIHIHVLTRQERSNKRPTS